MVLSWHQVYMHHLHAKLPMFVAVMIEQAWPVIVTLCKFVR